MAGFVSFNRIFRYLRNVLLHYVPCAIQYSAVSFSYCAGFNPSIPTLTPRWWSSASHSRWSGRSGSVRSVSRPSTLRVPPLEIAFLVCVCGVFCAFIHSVMSTSFPPTALTSKGVRYANAWPFVHVIDLEVGFMTRHIEGDVEQLTRTLATLKPRLEFCGRASVIPASNPTPHRVLMVINASCFGGIRILQAVHTIRFASTAVTSGTMIDPSYKLERFQL